MSLKSTTSLVSESCDIAAGTKGISLIFGNIQGYVCEMVVECRHNCEFFLVAGASNIDRRILRELKGTEVIGTEVIGTDG